MPFKETEKQTDLFDWLFRLYITPLVIHGLGAGTHTDTDLDTHRQTDTNIYTHTRTDVILRNQARASPRQARAWFKNYCCSRSQARNEKLLLCSFVQNVDQENSGTLFKGGGSSAPNEHPGYGPISLV